MHYEYYGNRAEASHLYLRLLINSDLMNYIIACKFLGNFLAFINVDPTDFNSELISISIISWCHLPGPRRIVTVASPPPP